MKELTSYLMVTLKGIGMGAADVIPGVSGGTIAFLTGIYETLINSIRSIDTTAIKLFFTFKWKEFWKHINGNFLLALIIGIGISVLSIAKIMTYLMVHHPIPLWSFFFGLIIASAVYILRDIKKWALCNIFALGVGIGAGAAICLLTPGETPTDLWFIFLSGAIAICAMILPGISGSFILLILGKYQYIMEAITGLVSARSKRLGDLLAGTYAQQERVPRAEHSVYGVPPALQGWATIADVGRMPDRLSRRIAQFLDQVDKLTPETRARLGRTLAGEAAAFVSPVPDTDPVLFLYAVSAVRRDREYAAHMLEEQRLATLTPVLTGRPHGFPER